MRCLKDFSIVSFVFSHLDLCMNPLISLNVFNQLPNDVQRTIFDYLLTPEASIKLFHSQAKWIKQMESINVDEFVSPDNLPEGKHFLLLLLIETFYSFIM